MSKIIRNKYKEKIRDGEKVKELDCPEGFKSVEGKCVPMSSTEKRHRSDAAHKVKRNHGIIQKYIDDKRIETMKDKKDEDVQKLKNVIREELKRILNESPDTVYSRMKMDGINNQGKILSENDKNDLEKALKNHDWNFQYSDDNQLYKQGKNEWENIKSLMIKVGKSQSKSLWKKFAPKNQKFPDSVFNPKIITKSTDKGERWYPTENIGENKMNKLNERKLSTLQKKYSDFFFDMLDQFDVKSPAQLSSDKKKEFFNRIKKEWPKEKRKTTNEGKIEIRDIIREIVLDELVDKDMLITIAKDRDFGSSIQNLIEWFSNAAKTMDHSKKKDMKDVVVDYVNRILSKV